jgi:hypothetical protein
MEIICMARLNITNWPDDLDLKIRKKIMAKNKDGVVRHGDIKAFIIQACEDSLK